MGMELLAAWIATQDLEPGPLAPQLRKAAAEQGDEIAARLVRDAAVMRGVEKMTIQYAPEEREPVRASTTRH